MGTEPAIRRCAEALGYRVKVLKNIQEEIEIARRYSDEAGYTFFILQRNKT